jgi:Ca-activated chloride channel homolog
MGAGAPPALRNRVWPMQTFYRCRRLGAAVLSTLAGVAPATTQLSDPPSLVIVIDGSGSMWAPFDATRQAKYLVARDALRQALDKANPRTRVGLVALGHRRAGDCNDVEVLRPPEPLDVERVMAPLSQVSPRGRGPLALALREAANIVPRDAGSRHVLLIHDDADNCQADVCAAAAELRAEQITAHVVGVGAKADDIAKMACVPQLTGGKHLNAQSAGQVAGLIEEVLQQSSLGGGASQPPASRGPQAVSLVPPPPIPASGPPALHLRALIAQSTAPIATPLHWAVTAEDGSRLFDGWASSPVVPAAAGRYAVEVRDGLISARQTVASGDRPMSVTLVLGAAKIIARPKPPRATIPLDDAIITISSIGSGSEETPVAVFKGASATALVPGGRYVVRTELGLVRAENIVTVAAGQTEAVDLPLRVARLTLSAGGREGFQPLESPTFSILEDDPDYPSGRREIARSTAKAPTFMLAPGTYHVVARQGIVEAREMVALKPGDDTPRQLQAPAAGRVSLSSRVTGVTPRGYAPSYLIRRIDDAAQETLATSEVSPTVFLPPGRYLVEGRYGPASIAMTREVEVLAGQTQDLVFEHGVAELKLRFLPSAGGGSEVFWDIRDGTGTLVWTSSQSEALAMLSAGRYRVTAETREKRYERQVEARSGETRTLDISGD